MASVQIKQTLRYRLFGIGKMDSALRLALEAEGLVAFSEGIPVTLRRSGSMPGRLRFAGARSLSGALAVSKTRIVGTASYLKLIDTPFAAAAPEGSATLSFSSEGLNCELNLAQIQRHWSGWIRIAFKRPFSAAELAELPCCELRFSVRAEAAETLFRWRGTRG